MRTRYTWVPCTALYPCVPLVIREIMTKRRKRCGTVKGCRLGIKCTPTLALLNTQTKSIAGVVIEIPPKPL